VFLGGGFQEMATDVEEAFLAEVIVGLPEGAKEKEREVVQRRKRGRRKHRPRGPLGGWVASPPPMTFAFATAACLSFCLP